MYHWQHELLPLTGLTNVLVAGMFQTLLATTNATGQYVATALNVSTTSNALNTTAARQALAQADGFTVDTKGLAGDQVDIGNNGALFKVPDTSTVAVLSLLVSADNQTNNGKPFGGDKNKLSQASAVYVSINNGTVPAPSWQTKPAPPVQPAPPPKP